MIGIKEILEITTPYITSYHKFSISGEIFHRQNGRKLYNNLIREQVSDNAGIYIWVNSKTDSIVYIGMAGKIKNDGSLADHSVQNRLLASRGKDKVTKKDIQTNDFVSNYMEINGVACLDFYILYSKNDEPASYVEALALYNYFKTYRKLPELNNSF